MSRQNPRILIISPVKDEAKYIEQTIKSMEWQTLRPALWIIVNDGSSDEAGEIADRAAAKHDWIQVVHRPAGTKRRVGPGVIEAFYAGLDHANMNDFDFVCKMDGDLVVPLFYFETMMEHFESNPRLGTGSGKCFIPVDGELVLERTGDEFSHGVAKLFRMACFKEIGGFVRQVMWDGIDCHRCRMLGWDAVSFDELKLQIIHLRIMGSSFKNVYVGRLRWGFGQYFMGSHPLYLVAISLYRMVERPWILGGLYIMFGYFRAWITRQERYDDLEFRKHLRQWQMGKLRDLITRTKRSPEHFGGNEAVVQSTVQSTKIVQSTKTVRSTNLEEDILRAANESLAASKVATGQASFEPAEERETVEATK
ncbi:MAG: biofilm PGA synthesis N-glycosyltransferase PgaC [Pirellulaceae bacterium]|jgi:biofilm PGA synthesis N-glycosyltransferase PgaC